MKAATIAPGDSADHNEEEEDDDHNKNESSSSEKEPILLTPKRNSMKKLSTKASKRGSSSGSSFKSPSSVSSSPSSSTTSSKTKQKILNQTLKKNNDGMSSFSSPTTKTKTKSKKQSIITPTAKKGKSVRNSSSVISPTTMTPTTTTATPTTMKKKKLKVPNSAPARTDGKKKVNSVKSSKRRGSTKDWWDLNDPNFLLNLEEDSEEDEGNGNKMSVEEIARRNDQVQKFRDKHQREMRNSLKSGIVAKLLEEAQPKERETKPIILPNVRAQPLSSDFVAKFEAPVYKKDADQKALLKETAKKNFILKDVVNTGAKTDIRKLMKAFENVEVKKGKNIVNQGDRGEHFYVVESGMVEFEVDNITVRTAGVGQTFGDKNLLFESPWNETIKASGNNPIKLLRLNHKTYRGLMATTEEAKSAVPSPPPKLSSKAEAKKEDENAWLINSKSLKEQNAIREALRKHTSTSADLEQIKVLGEGQFGEVWLVSKELPEVPPPKGKDQHEFALKIQNFMLDEEKMKENIRGEIKVIEELSHPFISSLYHTYESEESIDMVLGLVPGGELWDVVHQENEETGEWISGIPETHAQFYSMIVADTLNFIHNKGFIFRDLKMENIMIDAKGYPVIVDFGFAKECQTKRYTFCGTPNYVCPEIIKNIGHDAAADWWAFGIVIYEMISGENPFYYDGMDQMELYETICEGKAEPLKPGFSKPVIDIIDKLLVKDPAKRLGSGKKKGKAVLNHEFYLGLNLKRLRGRKVKAPWIPGQNQASSSNDYDAELENERIAAENERRREAELEADIRKAEEEVETARAEAARIEAETRAKAMAEEARAREEAVRLQAEEEKKARAREEAARLQAEEEKKARAQEEAARLQAEEEMKARAREEAARLQAEEEKKARAREEAARLKAEEERKAHAQKLAEEKEALRLQAEKEAKVEAAKRKRKEEKLRIAKEFAEEQERKRAEAEEKQRQIDEMFRRVRAREEEEEKVRRQAEEEARLEVERKANAAKAAAAEEEERLQREKEAAHMEDYVEEGEMSLRGGDDDGEMSLEEVFRPAPSQRDYESSWNEAVRTPRSRARRKLDTSPVKEGLVKEILSGHGKESPNPRLFSPRVQDELNKSIGKGLVAQRLAKAKEKEKLGKSLPSMFTDFQL